MRKTHFAGIFVALAFAALCGAMLVGAAAMTGVETGVTPGTLIDWFVGLLALAGVAALVEFFVYYSKNPHAK